MDSPEPNSQQLSVGSSIFQSPNQRRLILCLLLAATTIALYSPVMRAPFLNFDDGSYVTENPHVRAGLTWNTVAWAFRATEATNWHPVTWLSHALDCQLFGMNPAGPHIVNVLLHAVDAALLFLLLESATGLLWQSLAVAGLFALHPINVESVAWISERRNVLSMLFFLLALAAYGRYVRRPGVARYLAVTAAYALGLMSKPHVITFPFALLLLDYWPLRRLSPEDAEGGLSAAQTRSHTFWSLLCEKLPWIALSAASAIITMRVQAEATQAKLSPWIHLGNAAIAYVKYVGKALWPVNLAIVYPHPELSISVLGAVLSAAAIVAVTILAALFRRRVFFVGWFWFLGTMVPMAGLVQAGVQSMADRYAYIPLLGVFVILVWGVAYCMERWHLSKLFPLALSGIILVSLSILLTRQENFWRDNVTLWMHTLELTQGNYTAEDMLATALIAEGRIEQAVPHLRQAIAFRPDDAMATLNLATYDQMRGDYSSAIAGYARLAQFTKNAALTQLALINSGYAYMSLKDHENARRSFASVLHAQPANAAAFRGLGLAEQRAGNLAGAIPNYRQAAQIEPTAVNYLLLAQSLELAGQIEAARAAGSQAASLGTNWNEDAATVKRLLTE
jgi:protein O-mannosyl-transferase